MRVYLPFAQILIFIFIALFSSRGFSESGEGLLNKLLSPGPLIEGHKELEHKDCFSCHDTGEGVTDSKCLDCHKEIKKSIKEAPSFHSLTKEACFKCHSDHKGRTYDSTKINEKSFNHKDTGFNLNGAHKDIDCNKCHSEKRVKKDLRKRDPLYLGLTNSCLGCHKKDDIHYFTGDLAKKECSQCHNESHWDSGVTFNHNKDTDFKLIGAHAKQSCEKCHLISKQKKVAQYQWHNLKSAQCLSCHKDHHNNALSTKFKGGACDRCHGQNEWKIDNFDHRVTQFPLRGKHGQINCVDCHKQSSGKALKDFNWTGLKSACESCHRDYHGFANETSKRFGALIACQHCHNEQDWKREVDFDHNTDTSYRVDGKHKELACFKCHVTSNKNDKSKFAKRIYEWGQLEKKTCETCHKNPHTAKDGKFSKKACSSCHVTQGWHVIRTGKGIFNHDTETRFPLEGKHISIKCSRCHEINKKEVYKFPNAERQFCVTCHKNVHEQQFSGKFNNKSCAECHTAKDFKMLKSFNHNKTRFSITGQHQKIYKDCRQCHVKTRTPLPTTPPRYAGKFIFENPDQDFCIDCHKNIHKEQFTHKFSRMPCSECHSTSSFKSIQKFNHNATRFRLTGRHKEIEKNCKQCHKPSSKMLATKPPRRAKKFVFEGVEKDFCSECHSNVHKDQFHSKFSNMACSQCHTTKDFGKRTAFDHDRTRFDIRGKHKELKCEECHTQTKSLLTKKPKRLAHRFIFSDLYKRDCQTCHKDPHKGDMGNRCSNCHEETAWKKSLDFHKNFSLKGIHYTLTCDECHVEDRALSGLSENCIFCHRKDDVHAGTLPNCVDCHRQYFWEMTAFRHSMSLFPLRGAHRGLDCTECHSTGHYQGVASECRDCHQADAAAVTTPLHNSAAFFNCEDCHNQFSFMGQ